MSYNSLKRLEFENVETGVWSQREFSSFLTEGNHMSRADANENVSFLNSNGNNWIVFGDGEKGPNYWLFLYLEKK